MSIEIVRPEAATLPEKMEWARAMATSNLLPRQYQGNPGNLLFAVEYADALGVSRINAITSIHVIEGKPSASADLIASMVRRAGHRLRVSGDDTYAEAHLIRADDPEFTYTSRWDLAKARTAGLLGKNVWKAYPAAMLRSRAITEVARMGASDALFGVIYSPEELGAEVDASGELVHQVTTVRPAAATSGADRVRQAVAGAPTAAAAVTEEVAQVDGITEAQIKKMGATMREAGIVDREDALAFAADVIGRPIGSRNDLTKDEAARVITRLERQLAERPQAEEEPVEAELVPDPEPVSSGDPDVIWQTIVAEAARHGFTADNIRDKFAAVMGGLLPDTASADELAHFLTVLREQPLAEGVPA